MNEETRKRTKIKQDKLSYKRLTKILDYNPETGIFTNKINRSRCVRIGYESGYLDSEGYRGIGIDGVSYKTHRLAWFYIHKKWPVDQLDHINRVRDDNRICNLREATHSINMLNVKHKAEKRSGIEGICWDKRIKKWNVGHKKKYLCSVDSIEEGIKFQKQYKSGVFVKPPKIKVHGTSEKQSNVVGVSWDKSHMSWIVRKNEKFLGLVDTVEKGAQLLKEYKLGTFVKQERKNKSEKYSEIIGVTWNKFSSSWRIRKNGKYLGYKKSLKEAAQVINAN